MADPITLAAISGTTGAISEIGKELAKNEDFAKSAGESIKIYAQGQANIAESFAYGFRDLITKNAEVRAHLTKKFGDKFIDDFLSNPDIAAKKFADAVPHATRSARELGRLGRDTILSFPQFAGNYLQKVAEIPGKLYTGLKKGFETQPPEPPPGYVYQQVSGGGMGSMSGVQLAMIIVSIIFIIALIYWLVNNGHKKNIDSSGRITNTEGIIIGTGVIIIILSAVTYFA